MKRTAAEIQEWMVAWVSRRAGMDPAAIDAQAPLTRYGLDSLATVRLLADLEAWLGFQLRDNPFVDYPSIDELARSVAEQAQRCN